MVPHNHLSLFQTSFSPSFPLLFCFHGNNTSCIFNDERYSPSLSVSSLCSLTTLQEALNVYCILDRPTHSFMILNKCLVSITYLLRFHIARLAGVTGVNELMKLMNQSIYWILLPLKGNVDSMGIYTMQKWSNKER